MTQQEISALEKERRESRTELVDLTWVQVLVLKEQFQKKIYLNFPPNLKKCSIKLRPTINPDAGKFALVLIPTLIPTVQVTPRGSQKNSPVHESHPHPQINPHMNFVIWNCRGARSSEFRCSFRSLLDYHHPSLVVLLEMHLYEHMHLRDDFNFTSMASVAVEGNA